jgi:hypothetical protein
MLSYSTLLAAKSCAVIFVDYNKFHLYKLLNNTVTDAQPILFIIFAIVNFFNFCLILI